MGDAVRAGRFNLASAVAERAADHVAHGSSDVQEGDAERHRIPASVPASARLVRRVHELPRRLHAAVPTPTRCQGPSCMAWAACSMGARLVYANTAVIRANAAAARRVV